MRVKLLLENEAGVKKRRLWHLVDESCVKIADLAYLIKKQFYTAHESKVSLSLDGFLLPQQESIALLQNNDEITVKVLSHAPPSSSESSSSSEEEKPVKKNVPVKKTPFKKKGIVNSAAQVLQKVAKVITNQSSAQKNGKAIAAKHLVQSDKKVLNSKQKINGKDNDSSSEGTSDSDSSSEEETTKKSTVLKPKAKVPLKTNNNTTKPKPNAAAKSSSSDSSDSSSSDDDDKQTKKNATVAKKTVSTIAKTNNAKKLVPLSKLGVSNTLKRKKESSSESSNSSDSSDSSDDEKKKKKVPVVAKKKQIVGKKVTVVKSSSSSSSSSSDEEPEVITKNTKNANKKPSSVLPAVKNFLNNIPCDSKTIKMSPHLSNSNISIASTNKVDFQVSKSNKNNQKTSTPNNSNTNNGSAKAKGLAMKDVYKNKSMFLVSKPLNLETSNTSISSNNLSNNMETTTEGVGNSTAENVPAGVLRKRRRAKLRKERKRNLMQAEKEAKLSGESNSTNVEKDESVMIISSGNNLVGLNGNKENIDSGETEIDIAEGKEGEVNKINSNGAANINVLPLSEKNSCTDITEKPSKDYSVFESLTDPPDVGSTIAYKFSLAEQMNSEDIGTQKVDKLADKELIDRNSEDIGTQKVDKLADKELRDLNLKDIDTQKVDKLADEDTELIDLSSEDIGAQKDDKFADKDREFIDLNSEVIDTQKVNKLADEVKELIDLNSVDIGTQKVDKFADKELIDLKSVDIGTQKVDKLADEVKELIDFNSDDIGTQKVDKLADKDTEFIDLNSEDKGTQKVDKLEAGQTENDIKIDFNSEDIGAQKVDKFVDKELIDFKSVDIGSQKVNKLADKDTEFIDINLEDIGTQKVDKLADEDKELIDLNSEDIGTQKVDKFADKELIDLKSVDIGTQNVDKDTEFIDLNSEDNGTERVIELEAGQTESDIKIKAKYLCIAARQSLISKSHKQANIVCDGINKLLNEELDPNIRYELLFYKVQVERSPEFQAIKELHLHYSKEKNFLMTLLSLLTCSQRFPESVLELIHSDQRVSLKYLLEFSGYLFKILFRLSCNITISGISEESLLSDFGLQKDVADSCKVFYEDESKWLFLRIKTSSDFKNPLQNATSINISLAKTQISNILFKLVLRLITYCHFQMDSRINKTMSSIHVESCEYERCTELHKQPSAASFVAGFHVFLSFLELHAQAKTYYQLLLKGNKHDANDINDLQNLSVSKGTIFLLNRYFLYYFSYTHVLVIEKYSSCLRDDIPHSVHMLLQNYIEDTWKAIEDKYGFVNMNFFIQLSILAHLLNRRIPLTQKLFDVSFKEYRVEKKITNDYLDYFELFISIKGFASGVSNFERCLYKTIRYQRPSLFTICELIELPLITFFLSLSKLKPSLTFFIPEKMLSYKGLMEAMYDINIDDIIKHVRYRNKHSICKGLQTIINVLTGYRDVSFNAISILHKFISGFKDKSYETITKLSCERLLIIILVFLCNFSNLNFLRGRDQIINEFDLPPIPGEGRLADLFNKVSKITSDEHGRSVLAHYLSLHKQNLICCRSGGFRGNYYSDVRKTNAITTSVVNGKDKTAVRNNVSAVGNSQKKISTSSIAAFHKVIKTENDSLCTSTAQRLKTTFSSIAIQKSSTSMPPKTSVGSLAQSMCNVGKVSIDKTNSHSSKSKVNQNNSMKKTAAKQSTSSSRTQNSDDISQNNDTSLVKNVSKVSIDKTNIPSSKSKLSQDNSMKKTVSIIKGIVNHSRTQDNCSISQNIDISLVKTIAPQKNSEKDCSGEKNNFVQTLNKDIISVGMNQKENEKTACSRLTENITKKDFYVVNKIITEMLSKVTLNAATLAIQRWWRKILSKRERISKMLIQSNNHGVYFDPYGYCRACLIHVEQKYMQHHLRKGSDHFIQVELYDRFMKLSPSLAKVKEVFCSVDSGIHKTDFETRRSLILLRYNNAMLAKNWAAVFQLEKDISLLFNGTDLAIAADEYSSKKEDNALRSRSLKRKLPHSGPYKRSGNQC